MFYLNPLFIFQSCILLGDEDRFNDHIGITDSLLCRSKFKKRKMKILKQWIEDIKISDYTIKSDKYDILFLLLQGDNIIQSIWRCMLI